MRFRHIIIRTIIHTPEIRGFRSRPPILFTYTLEESGDEEVIPITAQIDTIDETRLAITDYLLVTRIIHRIVSIINHAIAVQVLELDIARKPLSSRSTRVEIGLFSVAIDISLRGKETFSLVSPDLTYLHTLVIVIIAQFLFRVIVFINR